MDNRIRAGVIAIALATQLAAEDKGLAVQPIASLPIPVTAQHVSQPVIVPHTGAVSHPAPRPSPVHPSPHPVPNLPPRSIPYPDLLPKPVPNPFSGPLPKPGPFGPQEPPNSGHGHKGGSGRVHVPIIVNIEEEQPSYVPAPSSFPESPGYRTLPQAVPSGQQGYDQSQPPYMRLPVNTVPSQPYYSGPNGYYAPPQPFYAGPQAYLPTYFSGPTQFFPPQSPYIGLPGDPFSPQPYYAGSNWYYGSRSCP